MKIFFYLAQFIIYFGESQITWKEIYNTQNWDDQDSLYPKQNWVYSNIDGGPFSQCGDSKLFGGYGVFGKSSFVSSNLILPTHNSIRITFDFWKIDQWDGEYFRCLIDDKKAAYKTYWGTQGESICGLQLSDCLEYVDTITITISPHLSPSLIVFMTSDLNSSSLDESWGFNNFKIEITECPEGCQFCKDLTSPCDHWFNFASYWNSQDESDRWQIDNNEQLGFSECANLKIAGGNGTLSGGNSIQKLIETLIPHFRVQIVFKLWGIGSWNNELFNLDIDDNTIQLIKLIRQIQLLNFLNKM
ncbi:unnamed protein product [Paramecium primaurelia]|uniref:Uncharacterized protein n=1 Tax=Paramecium primaurelia TaxID=5886 RepID=A0A8S1NZ63_PARPR|nr:unnamed protein product [Paramecium primaurelia]